MQPKLQKSKFLFRNLIETAKKIGNLSNDEESLLSKIVHNANSSIITCEIFLNSISFDITKEAATSFTFLPYISLGIRPISDMQLKVIKFCYDSVTNINVFSQ